MNIIWSNGFPRTLVLASASPRRKQLLEEMGFDLIIKPADIIEDNLDDLPPVKYAEHLSRKKATEVGKLYPEYITIGADTIVVAKDHILGKPENREDAFRMLSLLSGQKHEVITGVTIVKGEQVKTFHEITSVYFTVMSENEINGYIEFGEPMDKAGAYGIQGAGRLFISRIEGCYFNVVGFPVHRFYIVLKELTENRYYE